MAQKPTTTATSGPEAIYLGDEVTLNDTKRGVVRFIGPMEGKPTPIFYGVELKSGAGKNDGTSNAQTYFKCPSDKGVFTTKMKISKSKATPESKQFPHVTAGTRVNVTNKSQGVVRYIGHVSFGEDIWIGVELDEANGDHDGTVDKRWYFKCNDKHGVFVRSDAIEIIAEKKKPAATDTAKRGPSTTNTTTTTNATKKPIETKSPAKATKTTTNPALKNKTSVGGDKPKATTSSTTKPTTAKAKEGDKTKAPASKAKSPAQKTTAQKTAKSPAKKTTTTTAPKTGPAKTAPKTNPKTKPEEKPQEKEKPEEKEKSEEKEEIKVGDKVLVKPDKKGQVKYVGEASNIGPGVWYGVRLTEKEGQCDGEFKGHEFFQCPEGYGVYVQDTLIVRKLTDEEASGIDFMDEEKSIEAMKEARLDEVRKERTKLQAITQKFKELDTDGSKSLSREEFSKLAVEFLQCDPRSARELFSTVDTNGSGEISFAEFKKWLNTADPEIMNALVEEQKNTDAEAPTQEAASGSSPTDKTEETNTTVNSDGVVVNVDVFDNAAADDSVEVEDAPVDEATQENHASENSTENANENANESHEDTNGHAEENASEKAAETTEENNEKTEENTNEKTEENTSEKAEENTNEKTEENTNEHTEETTSDHAEEKAEDHQSNPENEPAEETTNEATSDNAPATEETGNNENGASSENGDNNDNSANTTNENPQ